MAKSTPVKNTPTKTTPKKKGSRPGSRAGSKKSTPTKAPAKKVVDNSIIPKARVTNAIEQLIKFTSQENEETKKQLLDDDDEISKSLNLIVVNTSSFTGASKKFKLKMLNIKNAMYPLWKEASTTSVKDFKTLLILKDSDIKKVSEDDLYDNLKDSNISIDEIVAAKDLKTTYKSYESRRAFISQFSLILSDDNVIPTLPKLLGAKAYNKLDTTPIPIRTYANKEFSIKTLVNSIKKVYLTQLPVKLPRGTTMNVHLGNLEWFKTTEIVENIESVVEDLIKNYKIRSVFIKSNKSPVLPLYYNQDVLDELVAKSKDESVKERDSVTIDGVEVQLSNFEKALMEIANPDNLSSIFSNKINNNKRSNEENEREEKQVKKAKN